MTGKLEDLYLLHSTSGENEAELAKELKAEIERLTDIIGEWSRQLGGLPQPRHPGRLISECDEAISRSLHFSEGGKYADAFVCLHRARAAIADISRAWDANLAYEAAQVQYEALKELAASDRLWSLLTFRNLARLLDQVLSLIERSKYWQAELLARACRRRCEILCERQVNTTGASQACLEGLSMLCDEVARFLPQGRPDWADKSALHDVEKLLLEEGYALSERLVDDLEVELTPHRTFLTIYQQFRSATRSPTADTDLRELIAIESWSAAASYLLQGVLGDLSDKLEAVPARAATIRQQVSEYQKLAVAK
jgi:hypothetical protein